MSMGSFGTAVSGLNAARQGLATVGHNMSNIDTPGYSRQRVNQVSYFSRTIGSNGSGLLQVGLGTDIKSIRQIRDKFLDAQYREQASMAGYYSVKYSVGSEIESILGELESEYKTQSSLSDIWDAVNDLRFHPEGIETREQFIATCSSFLTKVKNSSDKLYEHQLNVNDEIKSTVAQINDYVDKIDELNKKITEAEASGDYANDYRDSRNNYLDELSKIADITIKDKNTTGRIDILINGKELLCNGVKSHIGLRYSSNKYPFVEPVFTNSKEILGYGEPAREIYSNLGNENLSLNAGNTNGMLKGMLITRGNVIANYTTPSNETDNFMIPNIQKKLDTLVNAVVKLVNDAVYPKDGSLTYDINGDVGTEEIFIRKNFAANDKTPATGENVNDYASLYTTNNLIINPIFKDTAGYNKIALSKSGDRGDGSVADDISRIWEEDQPLLGDMTINNFYKKMIVDHGIDVEEANNHLTTQNGELEKITNDRFSLMSVSMDEELSNMLKYQHAFNAASKVINVLDSMIDKVINGTGRVGM